VLILAFFVQEHNGRSLAGRRTLRYLAEVQAWRRRAQAGRNCPEPAPCECHCDCPPTRAEKPPKVPLPCPTMPPLPAFWTPPPIPLTSTLSADSASSESTGKKKEASAECSGDEVILTDGSCHAITIEVVHDILQQVVAKKAELDGLQTKFATSLPSTAHYLELRRSLLVTHQEYLRLLNLLLRTMAIWDGKQGAPAIKAQMEEQSQAEAKEEFSPASLHGRVHCEPWTTNGTKVRASTSLCGVVCRNEPACQGFAIDMQHGWCLWFDHMVSVESLNVPSNSSAEPTCSKQTRTLYVKNFNVTYGEEMLAAIWVVRAYEDLLRKDIMSTNYRAQVANKSYVEWAKIHNISLQHYVVSAKQNYTGALHDALEMRGRLFLASIDAYNLAVKEAAVHPPLPTKQQALSPAPVASSSPRAPAGAAPIPAEAENPVPLEWRDFDNSGDTQWSQWHPECPMGAPCFCDCHCRGAPPQNFVEPPAVPPTPCPPLPGFDTTMMPPPSMFGFR